MYEHPGQEWAVIGPTYGDARDVGIEGPSGLLSILGPAVTTWNRSLGELRTVNGSLVRIDGADDGALRIQGHGLAGAWCVAEGEPVLTADGWTPIEQVQVGDLAWTRAGWRRVTAAAMTRRESPVLRIETEGGHSLRCTADHPTWVEDRGFTPAEDVRVGDILNVWKPSQVHRHGTTGIAVAGIAIGSATTRIAQGCSCTPLSGSKPTAGGFQTGTSSTTATMTAETTAPTTWKSCPESSILLSTGSPSPTLSKASRGSLLRRGLHGRSENRGHGYASSAEANTYPPGSGPSSASVPAHGSSTVSSIEWDGTSDVYDLTVDGVHEFYASGILVKNCDEVSLWWPRWEKAWDESLRFAVSVPPARIIASGTPKAGHPLARRLLDDPHTVAPPPLRTVDNVANLDAALVGDWMRDLAGTRLGRQELEGELLEDVEGALWTQALIDANRVESWQVPPLRHLVLAVDPATGGGRGDETGIVLGGDAMVEGTNHAYVLKDVSLRAGPEQTAHRIADTWDQESPGRLLVEEAFGQVAHIELILRSIGRTDIPVTPMPSRGMVKGSSETAKVRRLTPVIALDEAGRIHHVGELPELESQLTGWVPDVSDFSPDRVEARGYLCLWLLLGQGGPATLTVPKGRLAVYG